MPVFLFALDHILHTGIFQRSTWTFVEGLIAVAAAYVVGHLLAGLSSALLERRFVNKHIGKPSVILMGEVGRHKWLRYLYPEFYEPLPKATINKILAKGRSEGITEPGEALFWLAYDNVRKNRAAERRTGTFINLYGLCRNLSQTAVLVSAMLIVSAQFHGQPGDYWWAAPAGGRRRYR
jgi:hypothetical protein